MGYTIPVIFFLLFTVCTGFFLLYRRKNIGAAFSLMRAFVPIFLFFALGVYYLINPESHSDNNVVHHILVFLLALSFFWLSLAFRGRDRDQNRAWP